MSSTQVFKCKIKKGDEVVVLVGRSKGQTGKVDQLDRKNNRVFVSGVNVYKKHQKPGQGQSEGGIIEKTMSIHLSNVAIIDPKTKKPTKVGYRMEDGQKVRFAKASGTAL